MHALIAIDTLFFLFLSIIWDRKGDLNLIMKTFFAIIFLVNLFFVLKLSGYIIKVP